MFSRIAIVNRGEAAMRLIHAVRDLNAQAGPDGGRIATVALHTEGERRAMFVREADLAYDLGPAANRPYLDYAVLEKALVETGADAAWVGWGFVAEDPKFAELCARIGVTFIGPSPAAMRRLGDKIGSKLIAEEVGVPVAPWSGGGVDTLEDATKAAATIGYPLMLKATAGGGGRGIRMVASDADLADAYERTRDEAERAFGSGIVFLERLVTGARHVEVQVIADGQGTAWALGVRDCSVQRRNQKVVEESSSAVLSPSQVDELKASAERLALAVNYAGAGTVEFLYHPGEQFFAFLEVNTRLQVEHPITESTTDTDLVKLQIHIAGGGRLTGERPVEVGHAVEARLNAEDPDRDFAPSPGRIALLELPSGPGIRVDTGVGEGDSIPADFDSMIAKIIAFGRDRDEALARLRRAMQETTVVIEGGSTNKSFVLDLLSAPEVIDAHADTGWIDRVRSQGGLVAHRHSGVALVAAGIEAYETEESLERNRLVETARGGRPQVQHRTGRGVDLKLRGNAYKVTVFRTGPQRFRVVVANGAEEQAVEAELDRLDAYKSRLTVGGSTHRLVTATHGPVQLVEVDGVTHRVSLDEGRRAALPRPRAGGGHPGRARRRGGGRRSGAGAGVDEDGDGADRTVRRPRTGAAGVRGQSGRDRRPAGPAGAGGRRRRGSRPRVRGHRPGFARGRGTVLGSRAAGRDPSPRPLRRAARLRRGPHRQTAAPSRPTWPTATSWWPAAGRRWPASSICWRRSPTSPTSTAIGRPVRTCTWRTRCTVPASTSTPTCAAWIPTGARCRTTSARSSAGCCGTTG